MDGDNIAVKRRITAHQVNECNSDVEIMVTDEPGSGGANHEYRIQFKNGQMFNFSRDASGKMIIIPFQRGPIKENGTNGLTHEILLALVQDRLMSFQNGPFACQENALALDHVNAALKVLHDRTKARMARGVEGTHKV